HPPHARTAVRLGAVEGRDAGSHCKGRADPGRSNQHGVRHPGVAHPAKSQYTCRNKQTVPQEGPMSDLGLDDLKTIYPPPAPRAVAKQRPEADEHAANFIRLSPFCVFASAGPDGTVDASPRGGNPGFVHVAGPDELRMPDRSGNNRIDSYRNILSGAGYVQL